MGLAIAASRNYSKAILMSEKSLITHLVQGTNFSPSEPPGEIMSFGVSPVNYSDSDSQAMGKGEL